MLWLWLWLCCVVFCLTFCCVVFAENLISFYHLRRLASVQWGTCCGVSPFSLSLFQLPLSLRMAPSNLEIFEVKPSCGSIGQWVYVAGSGFIKPVSLVCHSGSHGVAASAEVYSETDLAFMVPEAAPAQFTITVLSGNRVCHSAQVFSVLESDPPQLERVTPERVAVGDQVWLQGHGFTAHESMAVHLEGRLVKDVQVYSESVAACVIPLDACEKEVQEVVVTVTTHKGVSGPCIIEVVGDAGALKQTTDQSSSSSQDMLVDAMPTQPLKSVALEADPQALQPEVQCRCCQLVRGVTGNYPTGGNGGNRNHGSSQWPCI